MTETRVVVCGTTEFVDYRLAAHTLNRLLGHCKRRELLIVSGNARGGDKMGETWAQRNGFRVQRFPAEWKHPETGMYDPDGGFKRNTRMAEFAVANGPEFARCIAFWDGRSGGTRDMIVKATELLGEKSVRVIRYQG